MGVRNVGFCVHFHDCVIAADVIGNGLRLFLECVGNPVFVPIEHGSNYRSVFPNEKRLR